MAGCHLAFWQAGLSSIVVMTFHEEAAMHHAACSDRRQRQPETVVGAWANTSLSVASFQPVYYAAYWFSQGVPLADA